MYSTFYRGWYVVPQLLLCTHTCGTCTTHNFPNPPEILALTTTTTGQLLRYPVLLIMQQPFFIFFESPFLNYVFHTLFPLASWLPRLINQYEPFHSTTTMEKNEQNHCDQSILGNRPFFSQRLWSNDLKKYWLLCIHNRRGKCHTNEGRNTKLLDERAMYPHWWNHLYKEQRTIIENQSQRNNKKSDACCTQSPPHHHPILFAPLTKGFIR